MSNFITEEISSIKLNKDETDKVVKIKRKNNKKMDMDDILQIDALFQTKLKGNDFYIRVLGNHGFFSPKGFGYDINLDTIEDYTKGKVHDNRKFADEFFYVEIGFTSKNKKV